MEYKSVFNSKQILKNLHSIFRRTGKRIIIGSKSSQQIYLVEPASLMYIEAAQNYTDWYFSDGSQLTLTYQLNQCETFITSQLGDEDILTIARVGRSAIVNLQYITQLDMTNKQLVISNRRGFVQKITVSEEILKKLKEAIILYKESNENR